MDCLIYDFVHMLTITQYYVALINIREAHIIP